MYHSSLLLKCGTSFVSPGVAVREVEDLLILAEAIRLSRSQAYCREDSPHANRRVI